MDVPHPSPLRASPGPQHPGSDRATLQTLRAHSGGGEADFFLAWLLFKQNPVPLAGQSPPPTLSPRWQSPHLTPRLPQAGSKLSAQPALTFGLMASAMSQSSAVLGQTGMWPWQCPHPV